MVAFSTRLDPKNQKTVTSYYAHVNQGEFQSAMQYLNNQAIYRMPGYKPGIPFAGDWRGQEEVQRLYETFARTFWIVQMSETLVLNSPNEVLSFNDEAFKSRSTGLFYRVGVAHHMKFDDAGLICEMDTYFDTTPAEQAFAGNVPIVQPMLTPPFPPFEDIENTEEQIARQIAYRFSTDSSEREILLAENANLVAPGNPKICSFAGAWLGRNQVLDHFRRYDAELPKRRTTIKTMIANRGWIGVISTDTWQSANKNRELPKVELYQISGQRIARIFIYLDTRAIY